MHSARRMVWMDGWMDGWMEAWKKKRRFLVEIMVVFCALLWLLKAPLCLVLYMTTVVGLLAVSRLGLRSYIRGRGGSKNNALSPIDEIIPKKALLSVFFLSFWCCRPFAILRIFHVPYCTFHAHCSIPPCSVLISPCSIFHA